jgi:hypothetical protein
MPLLLPGLLSDTRLRGRKFRARGDRYDEAVTEAIKL